VLAGGAFGDDEDVHVARRSGIQRGQPEIGEGDPQRGQVLGVGAVMRSSRPQVFGHDIDCALLQRRRHDLARTDRTQAHDAHAVLLERLGIDLREQLALGEVERRDPNAVRLISHVVVAAAAGDDDPQHHAQRDRHPSAHDAIFARSSGGRRT
jgi:hypothetical protein